MGVSRAEVEWCGQEREGAGNATAPPRQPSGSLSVWVQLYLRTPWARAPAGRSTAQASGWRNGMSTAETPFVSLAYFTLFDLNRPFRGA